MANVYSIFNTPDATIQVNYDVPKKRTYTRKVRCNINSTSSYSNLYVVLKGGIVIVYKENEALLEFKESDSIDELELSKEDKDYIKFLLGVN